MVYAEIEEAEHLPPPVKRTESGPLAESVAETLKMLNQAKAPVILACAEVHRFGLQEQVVALAEQLAKSAEASLYRQSLRVRMDRGVVDHSAVYQR